MPRTKVKENEEAPVKAPIKRRRGRKPVIKVKPVEQEEQHIIIEELPEQQGIITSNPWIDMVDNKPEPVAETIITAAVADKPEDIAQPEIEPDTTPEINIKKSGGRIWWMVAVGACLVVMGFAGFVYFATSQNMAIGLFSVLAVIGGGFLAYHGFKTKDEGIIITQNGVEAPTITANSLNIYPDSIKFEELPRDQLKGQPRRCRNDGKYYWVNIWGTSFKGKSEGLVPFVLPDTQYRDPKEFANNLNIPAHRDLFAREASLLEKISPGLIIVGMIVLGIVWAMTTPTAPPPGG